MVEPGTRAMGCTAACFIAADIDNEREAAFLDSATTRDYSADGEEQARNARLRNHLFVENSEDIV